MKRLIGPIVVATLLVAAYLRYSGIDNYMPTLDLVTVEDVVLGRYEKRTEEFFKARNQFTIQQIKKKSKNLKLYDDLAVGLARLNEFEKALEAIDKKKPLIDSKDARSWYTYHSNRGSILTALGLQQILDKGDPRGKFKLKEGIIHLEKAKSINPHDRFQRESLELVTTKWYLRAVNSPSTLVTENLFGVKSLDRSYLASTGGATACGEAFSHLKADEPIEVTCAKALQYLVAETKFGQGENPYTFITIGDILTASGYRESAFYAYATAIRYNHLAKDKIKQYMRQLAATITPEESSPTQHYNDLWYSYRSQLRSAKAYAEMYQSFERDLVKQKAKPTTKLFMSDFKKMLEMLEA